MVALLPDNSRYGIQVYNDGQQEKGKRKRGTYVYYLYPGLRGI
jgi:hypothetical protein